MPGRAVGLDAALLAPSGPGEVSPGALILDLDFDAGETRLHNLVLAVRPVPVDRRTGVVAGDGVAAGPARLRAAVEADIDEVGHAVTGFARGLRRTNGERWFAWSFRAGRRAFL